MKKSIAVYRLLMAVIISWTALQANAQANANAGDAKTYLINLTNPSTNDQIQDVIILRNGMIESTHFSKEGFMATAYRSEKKADGNIALNATVNNDADGTVKWKIQMKGEKLEGGVIVERTGQPPVKYIIDGTQAKMAK